MSGVSVLPAGLGASPAVLPRANQANHHQDPRFEAILQKVKLGQQLVPDDLDSAQQVIEWQTKRIEKLKQNIDIYKENLKGIAGGAAKSANDCERLKTDNDDLRSSNKDLSERNQKLEKIPTQLDEAHNKYEKMKKKYEKLVESQKKLNATVDLLKKQNTNLTNQLNNSDICSQVKVYIGKVVGCLSSAAPAQDLLTTDDIIELEEKKNPLKQVDG